VAGPIRSLDPAFAESNAEILLVSNLTESLLSLDPEEGFYRTSAAKSYSVSEDGKTLTFKLRDDLFWSNGEKITASDFVYSFKRLLDPKTDSWVAPLMKSIKGADEYHSGALVASSDLGIRAPNSKTIVIQLAQRDPLLFRIFATPATAPVHQKTIDRSPKSWTKPDHWVGSGPFVPAEKGTDHFVFQKNPHHRNVGSVVLDEVQVSLVASTQEGIDLYTAGSIDQFGYRDFDLNASQIEKFAGRNDVVRQPDFGVHFLRLNTGKLPLSQQKFREALAMSIDRQLLVSGVTLRGEISAYSILPTSFKGYSPPTGYLFSESGARIELKDLEYCTRGFAPKECRPVPTMEMIYRDQDDEKKIALALEAIWKQTLGITRMKLTPKTDDQFLRVLRDGEYQIVLDSLAAEPERAFDLLHAFAAGRTTAGAFRNKVYDQLLEDAKSQAVWGEAKKTYRQAEALLMREGGVIPLFHDSVVTLVQPYVKGYLPNIWDLHPFSAIRIEK
jgi:oligopeptide transport system substrate-binding protein